MGKLHTLRRAIKREPGKWHGMGASLNKLTGLWSPVRPWFRRSYMDFVRKVLSEVGHTDNGRGGTGE